MDFFFGNISGAVRVSGHRTKLSLFMTHSHIIHVVCFSLHGSGAAVV